MKKYYEAIPVSSGELPEESNRYGVILEGEDCIDSAFFMKVGSFWTSIGEHKVEFWLKEITINIPTPEEIKEMERSIADKAFDAGRSFEWSLKFPPSVSHNQPDKEQYLNSLK
jgi:hypothetical protein